MEQEVVRYVVFVVVAYLLGSIPSAVWIGKRFYGVDVRQHGSCNAGATNTLRVLGWRAALPVFATDVLKGFAAVSLATLSGFASGTPEMYNLKFVLAITAVLGHIFPLFARFRGGKGVATLAGAVLGIVPGAVLLCLAVFVAVLLVSRYVSLSSITAGILLPVFVVFVFGDTYPPLVVFCCLVSVLLLVTHRKNIGRLFHGKENKISFRSSTDKTDAGEKTGKR